MLENMSNFLDSHEMLVTNQTVLAFVMNDYVLEGVMIFSDIIYFCDD